MNRFFGYGIILSLLSMIIACNRYDNPALANLSHKIVYNVLVDETTGNYDIFIMNMDGSNKQNITNSPSMDWVYHGYKDKIYFISDRDTAKNIYFLYQMDLYGKDIQKITQFALENSWIASRNGAEEFVVASAKDSVRHELYLIDKTGQEIKRLTDNAYYDNDPSFSPDGKKIVFRSRRPKIDELYIMDLNLDTLRQLTNYPVNEDPSPGDFHYHAGPPFWEPNHNIITFMSYKDFNYDIYQINPDGSGLKKLIYGPYNQGWHYWSADGKYITYDGTDDAGNYDIYLMEYETGNVHRLTHKRQLEQAPVFVENMNADNEK